MIIVVRLVEKGEFFMGSAGSGSFGTYRIGNGLGGDGPTSGGKGGNEVECPQIIENIRLEDVATSDYYLNHQILPGVGSEVQLRDAVHFGRLVVETVGHEVIGNLPTNYNYLLNCIKKGFHYSGYVVSSGDVPIPYVVVTLNA